MRPLRPNVTLLLAALALVALVPACGKKDPASPAPAATGPTFDFSYPGTATSHSFTFTQAGDWDFHCAVHPTQMTGKVFVRQSSARSTATITVAPGNVLVFSPDTVTVGVGAIVTWSSAITAVPHTVTRP